MRAHRSYEEEYVIGEFRPDGSHVYMSWGVDCYMHYIDRSTPERAERFDSAQEARKFLEKDRDAKDWHKSHPHAKVLRIITGWTVYPPR